MKETYVLPGYILEKGLNPDIAHRFLMRCGDLNTFKEMFLEKNNNEYYIKSDFFDMVCHVPQNKVDIQFIVVNDASITSRRYQEASFCQTPLWYSYEDLMLLYRRNIPKVRQRNASSTFLEPLVSEKCAKYLILKSLINATPVDGLKKIVMTLTSKSLKISYSYNPQPGISKIINTRKKYFEFLGINLGEVESEFNNFIKHHRPQYRYSYYKGTMILEILYNVRQATFKRYYISLDKGTLLTKAEYDIYNFVRERGGATLKLIADEFGYNSPRAVEYHVNKLINLGLVSLVGGVGSHNTFYRIK